MAAGIGVLAAGVLAGLLISDQPIAVPVALVPDGAEPQGRVQEGRIKALIAPAGSRRAPVPEPPAYRRPDVPKFQLQFVDSMSGEPLAFTAVGFRRPDMTWAQAWTDAEG